jgi:single-strand DNA-binding protein
MSFNQATFHGRLGRDPESRFFESGQQVTNFSIAVDRPKDRDGNKIDALWVKCAVWGKRAQVVADHFRKGSEIIVTGPIDLEMFTDRNTGAERPSLTMRVSDFGFAGGGRDDQQHAPSRAIAAPAPTARSAYPWAPPVQSGPIDHDGIPF